MGKMAKSLNIIFHVFLSKIDRELQKVYDCGMASVRSKASGDIVSSNLRVGESGLRIDCLQSEFE